MQKEFYSITPHPLGKYSVIRRTGVEEEEEEEHFCSISERFLGRKCIFLHRYIATEFGCSFFSLTIFLYFSFSLSSSICLSLYFTLSPCVCCVSVAMLCLKWGILTCWLSDGQWGKNGKSKIKRGLKRFSGLEGIIPTKNGRNVLFFERQSSACMTNVFSTWTLNLTLFL